MYSKEFVALTGLHTIDLRIITAIERSSLRISDIQKKLRYPRSTIAFRINVLKKKGLVACERRGKRFFWYPLPQGNILRSSGAGTYQPVSSITTYRGVPEMISLWYKIVALPKNTRLVVVQPHQSFKLALLKSPREVAIDISKKIKEKGFVIDAIGHQKYVDIIASIYGQSKDTENLAEAFMKRFEDIAKVPDSFLDEQAEMFLYTNHIIFMDWNAEVSIEIENEALYKLMLSVFEKVKAYGSRYSLGEDLEERIKSK